MVKIILDIEIYLEYMFSESREKVIEGKFTFAVVNDKGKPLKIK